MSYRNVLTAVAISVALTLAGTGPTVAQEGHVVDRAELDRAAGERVEGDRARRRAIRSVLQRPEVRRVAEARGIELTRAEDAVATLEGTTLAKAYRQAKKVEAALAGGDQIVISTTVVIIILLVLILISVN